MKEEIYFCDVCGEKVMNRPRNSPYIKRKTGAWSEPVEEQIHVCNDCGHPWIEKVHKTFDRFLVEDNQVVGLENNYYDRDEMEDKRSIVMLEELNQDEHGNVPFIETTVEFVDNILSGHPAKYQEEEDEEDEDKGDDVEEIKIDSINSAVDRIHAEAGVEQVTETNKGRHKAVKTEDGKTYWVLYKRDEGFFKFGEFFDSQEDGELGESINQHPLHEALKHDIDYLLFVYQNGDMLVIEPEKFKEYAEENNTIRSTSYGETTYSVPKDKLKEWNP